MRGYALGAMLLDSQFKRAEDLEAKAMRDLHAVADKATSAVAGVKGALLANALISGLSTLVLVTTAMRRRRG